MPPMTRKLKRMLSLVLPVAALLLAAACNGPSIPSSPEPARTLTGVTITSRPASTPARAPSSASNQVDRLLSPSLQGNKVEFERLSLEEGLSQSVVLSILQDSRGFMWFGTQDGLNRYDGYEFAVYKHDPEDPDTLGNNFVQAILEDPSGLLWIGTNGGGLSALDPETGRFTRYQHDPNDPQSLSNNFIESILQDREGVLWVGTNGGGLDKLDRETGQFVHYRNDPQNPDSLSDDMVDTLYEDREGVLWIGTNGGGLDRFERGTGRFVHYQNDPQDPHSLSSNEVCSIHQDRAGVLWIGTSSGGLNKLDRETEQFVRYQNDPQDPHSLSNDQVWAIHEDYSGQLWIGTFGGGLDRFDRETGQFIHYQNDPQDPHSLSNDQVESIYEDRVGVLWIGTFGGGVNRLDRERIKFVHYRADPSDSNSLSENVVWSICEGREGVLWIGTYGGGLNRLDRETHQFTHYRNVPADPHSLSDDAVWSIYQDQEGLLWVGTGAGLDRFDPETQQTIAHYPAMPVFTIFQDRQGLIWIGTWGGGLGRLDPETDELTFFKNDPSDIHSLGDNSVLSIREDSEGGLWIGTFSGGLVRFDHISGQFTHYRNKPDDPKGLSHNTVLSIHEDREGVLWIATGGGGLNRFDRATGTFRHYREKDGLPNDTVYGILEDDVPAEQGGPHLWLSTNRGLSRFSPQTETFRNYDVADGLQSNEFNQGAYHRGRSGEMYFGGVNGFNAFFPEQVRDNAYIPPIVLTSLTQGGEELDLGTAVESLTEVTFKWPNNFFEFEFAALGYTQSDKNQYAYMLEGFDSGWIESGTRRFGRYTNLPGGTYTLRMKGSNNDGLWNEQGHSLTITVEPPFWQTWWFQGAIALVVVMTAIGAYRLRVRSVEARSRQLAIQVDDRTRELAALNAVAAVVSRSLDLQEILNDALAKTLQVTQIEAGGVYLLDDETGMLTIATHRGFSREFVSEVAHLRLGEGFSGHVAQSGEPLIVGDISTDERLTTMTVREEGFHSLVSVPLSSKGRVIGTLFAVTRGYREFTEQDIQLLTSIGHQVGVALENARLFQAEQRRAEQFYLISEVGRRITSILTVDELLLEVTKLIRDALEYDRVSIGLVEGDEVVFKAATGSGWDLPSHHHMHLKVGQQGVTGWVAGTGQPLLIPDVSKEPRFIPTSVQPPSLSELAVPLRTEGGVIGVLNVESTRLDAFDESDLAVLQSLANQAAVAIEKAQLLEAERQRADELDALRTTMAEITAELELPALLQAIVERAAGLLDATGGEFGLYDEASQELCVVVSYNLGEDYVGTHHRLGEGAMGRVAETGQSLIIEDYQTWEGGLTQYPHVHATLATPLKVGGRLVGVFTTVSTDPDRRFTPADLRLLNLFAQQAAIAIENARLYEQAQHLAVVEERQRLARDLHDSVTQALYGMSLYSEAATEELSLQHLDLVAEYLRELHVTAKDALAEMRLLIHELRPHALAEEGLVAALQARLLAVEGRAGLKTRFTVDVEQPLPSKVEEGLYRIAQEALNNVLKHAQATNIAVHLGYPSRDRKATLEILDDGIGFDPVTVREKGGLGLSAMEERAAEMGGRLSVESGAQRGTRVFVEVLT